MTVEWPVDVKGFMSLFQMLGQGMPCYQVPPQSAWDDVYVCGSKELTDLAVSNHEFKGCAGCKKAACICLYQVCMEKMSNSNAAMCSAVRNSKLLLSILILTFFSRCDIAMGELRVVLDHSYSLCAEIQDPSVGPGLLWFRLCGWCQYALALLRQRRGIPLGNWLAVAELGRALTAGSWRMKKNPPREVVEM